MTKEISTQTPLYFLHIPKTTGTSLSTYLNSQFKPEQVIPQQLWLNVYPAGKGAFEGYHFYKGHFGLSIKHVVAEGVEPHFITVIRDPVERTISQFHHLKSIFGTNHDSWADSEFMNKDTHINDLLFDEYKFLLFANAQTRYLGVEINPWESKPDNPYYSDLDPDFIRPKITDDQILKNAFDTLNKCVAVGETPRLDNLILELQNIFGFTAPSFTPREMVIPGRPNTSSFLPKTIRRIKEITKLDQELIENYSKSAK